MSQDGSEEDSSSGTEPTAFVKEMSAIGTAFSEWFTTLIPAQETGTDNENANANIRSVTASDFITDIQKIIGDFEEVSKKSTKEMEEKGEATINYSIDKAWGDVDTGLDGFTATIPSLKFSINAVGKIDQTTQAVSETGNASLTANAKASLNAAKLLASNKEITETPLKALAASVNCDANVTNISIKETYTENEDGGTTQSQDVDGDYSVSLGASFGVSLCLPDPTDESGTKTIGGKIISTIDIASTSSIQTVVEKIKEIPFPQASQTEGGTQDDGLDEYFTNLKKWANELPVSNIKVKVAAYDDNNKETYVPFNANSLEEFVDQVVKYLEQISNALNGAEEESQN